MGVRVRAGALLAVAVAASSCASAVGGTATALTEPFDLGPYRSALLGQLDLPLPRFAGVSLRESPENPASATLLLSSSTREDITALDEPAQRCGPGSPPRNAALEAAFDADAFSVVTNVGTDTPTFWVTVASGGTGALDAVDAYGDQCPTRGEQVAGPTEDVSTVAVVVTPGPQLGLDDARLLTETRTGDGYVQTLALFLGTRGDRTVSAAFASLDGPEQAGPGSLADALWTREVEIFLAAS